MAKPEQKVLLKEVSTGMGHLRMAFAFCGAIFCTPSHSLKASEGLNALAAFKSSAVDLPERWVFAVVAARELGAGALQTPYFLSSSFGVYSVMFVSLHKVAVNRILRRLD